MSNAALEEPPEKPSQTNWPGFDEATDSKRDRVLSIIIGLCITLLFHLAFVLFIPWKSLLTVEPVEVEKSPPLELEFVEYELPKFVETNPNVAPERPAETNNIAAQDQVAAQENPDPSSDSDRPQVDGELQESPKIVDGAISEPTPPPEPEGEPLPEQPQQPPVEQQEVAEAQEEPVEEQPVQDTPQVQEQAPEVPEPDQMREEAAPEAIEQETTEAEGELAMQDPAEADLKEEIPEEPKEEEKLPEPQPEEVEEPKPETSSPPKEAPKIMMEEVAPQTTTQSGAQAPKARPKINFRVPAGPLMQQGRAANRMGQLAIDANFSEFGAYQQRMIEAISAQWNLLGTQARYTGADIGTNCIVEFTLDRNGEVSNVRVLHSSSSSAGTLMTMESIKSRAPYGPWTQDMIKVLGDRQTVRINFFYR